MDKAEKGLEMKEREVFGKCGDYERLHLKKESPVKARYGGDPGSFPEKEQPGRQHAEEKTAPEWKSDAGEVSPPERVSGTGFCRPFQMPDAS